MVKEEKYNEIEFKELVHRWRKHKIMFNKSKTLEEKAKTEMKDYVERFNIVEGEHFGLKLEKRYTFVTDKRNIQLAKNNNIKIPVTPTIDYSKLIDLAKKNNLKIPTKPLTNFKKLEEIFEEKKIEGNYSVVLVAKLGS